MSAGWSQQVRGWHGAVAGGEQQDDRGDRRTECRGRAARGGTCGEGPPAAAVFGAAPLAQVWWQGGPLRGPAVERCRRHAERREDQQRRQQWAAQLAGL